MRRRVYRAQGASQVIAWVLAALFFTIGVVMAVGSPSTPDKGGTANVIFGVAIGVGITLLSLWMLAVLATSGVIVTADGLTTRRNLRPRLISWPEVASFTVGPGRGRNHYPTLIILLTDGSRVVTGVTSFTGTYPSLVARELTALHARAAAGRSDEAALTGGDDQKSQRCARDPRQPRSTSGPHACRRQIRLFLSVLTTFIQLVIESDNSDALFIRFK